MEKEEIEGGGNQWVGARVFVATTTSGLAASMSLQEKEEIWSELGSWVEQRRKERAEVAAVEGKVEEDNEARSSNIKDEGMES
jgi:thymine-DNA glycosylase